MIVQAGPYPPPYGGISAYIERMKKYLDDACLANQVWNTAASGLKNQGYRPESLGSSPAAARPSHNTCKLASSGGEPPEEILAANLRTLPFKYMFRKDIRLIHYNICGKRSKYYIGFLNRLFFGKRKKILTIHGDCSELYRGFHLLLTWNLNSFDALICVRPGDKAFLRTKGLKGKIYEIPAFIPPNTENNVELPDHADAFIRTHPFIICANASSITFQNGTDLYGIDMFAELAVRLQKSHPERGIGLIFCLPEIDDKPYYDELQCKIAAGNAKKDFLFISCKLQFHNILRKSRLFIRPTCSDGYSISLAEAVCLKVPSISSDAAQRPESVILFKTRDMEDLFHKTVSVIDNYQKYKSAAERASIENNAGKILALYRELAGI
jgi:glycosyltransferase involved in cell wall biosynthesis